MGLDVKKGKIATFDWKDISGDAIKTLAETLGPLGIRLVVPDTGGDFSLIWFGPAASHVTDQEVLDFHS